MKKLIISILTVAIGVSLFSTTAFADSFNSGAPVPTVTVTNATTQPCAMGGNFSCWKSSTTAVPGDAIAVQVFYVNNTSQTARQTTISIQPSRSGNIVQFYGGVASTTIDRAAATATVTLSQTTTITYMDGDQAAKWYPSAGSAGQPVIENDLFGSTGFNIGDIPPGGQGVLVARFHVDGSQVINPPTNYCSIDSFYVDSNSLTQGQVTQLHWSTSGGNSVYIAGLGTQAYSSGSISISPYTSTNYTLTLNGGNCSGTSRSVYVTVNQSSISNSQPQAITTVATGLTGFSAQLNGIAIPNSNYGATSAWFEYGNTTSLGTTSNRQNVTGSNYPYNSAISGLVPGATYYYRAVVQNQNGTAYGSTVRFTTTSDTTYVPPVRVVQSQTVTRTNNTGLIANSQASLFKLQVDSSYDHMCIGGDVDYTVTYQNISSQTLQNSILRITFPGELTYANSSRGDYDVTDRTLTISLGDVQAGEQGTVTVHAQVNNQAVEGKLAVITATMVYTNPTTHAQENAIAYSLITVSNDCPSVLGASVFGFGSFLPQTLLEWLLLILVILALIVLARTLSKKKEEPTKTA